MKKNTSWENVSDWYGELVGDSGHYYHEQIILPHLKDLLKLSQSDKLLDVACGDGILGRSLAKNNEYLGIDLSKNLISQARAKDKNKKHTYEVADASGSWDFEGSFTHSAIILALQNIENAEQVFLNLAKKLTKGGVCVFVINHPCFRIPRQSSWGVDATKKLQYRRIDRYMTPLDIPIQSHPSKGQESAQTISFHRPLSFYAHCLSSAGFYIESIDEWCSDKKSTGGNARMENRAREEFPLFMAVKALLK